MKKNKNIKLLLNGIVHGNKLKFPSNFGKFALPQFILQTVLLDQTNINKTSL